MSQDLKDDFQSVCARDVRRSYGGINFVNLSCLDNAPDHNTYAIAANFLNLLPRINEEIASPPTGLRQSFEQVKGDITGYMNYARKVALDPMSDESRRTAAATISGNPLLGMAYKVDDHVNRAVTYTKDSKAFGKDDVWRLPDDTARNKQGDCEDYAILKYAMLRKLGFPDDKMWLLVGRSNNGLLADSDGHAALMIEIDNKSFVMNNNKKGGLEPLEDFLKEGRSFVPQMIMNGREAFVVEDPKMRSLFLGQDSMAAHAVKSMLSLDTLKADWRRMTSDSKTPQFDF